MLYPFIMALLRDFHKEKLQHFPQISDHGGINCNILVDLRCIYINLQDLCLRCEGLCISCHTVAEACTKSDQKVTLTHCVVGSFGSMHSNRTCVKLILSGKSPFSHKAVADRSLDLVGKCTDFFRCICDHSTAANKNKWLFRCCDHLGCCIHILRTDGVNLRLYGCDGVTDIFTFCCGYVLWHIYEYRTRTTAFGDDKSFADGVCKLCYIFDNIAVFCHRHYNACDINFLEGIFSKKGSSNITGNCYHRNRVHTRGGNSGYQVGCTWAGSCQTHADLSCRTGVTVCRVGSSLLMGSKYMFNFITVSVKGVINVQNSSAWISENGIHTLLQQTFYDDLRSCKLQFHFLLVYYTVKIPDICYERTILS